MAECAKAFRIGKETAFANVKLSAMEGNGNKEVESCELG